MERYKKPVAVLEDVTSNLSASQTITFKLYDTAEGKTNTGSDIADIILEQILMQKAIQKKM